MSWKPTKKKDVKVRSNAGELCGSRRRPSQKQKNKNTPQASRSGYLTAQAAHKQLCVQVLRRPDATQRLHG